MAIAEKRPALVDVGEDGEIVLDVANPEIYEVPSKLPRVLHWSQIALAGGIGVGTVVGAGYTAYRIGAKRPWTAGFAAVGVLILGGMINVTSSAALAWYLKDRGYLEL